MRIISNKRTEQFNFFNWLSNVKNLVFSYVFKNVQNLIQMTLKKPFFSKTYEESSKASGSWGPRPKTPVCNTFELHFFLTAPPLQNLTHILKTLTFGSSLPPLATSCFLTNPGPRLLIFDSEIFLSHKKSLLLKIFDDVLSHVMCGSGSSN